MTTGDLNASGHQRRRSPHRSWSLHPDWMDVENLDPPRIHGVLSSPHHRGDPLKRLSGGRLLYQIARGIVLLAVSLPSGSVAQTSGVVISEGLVIAGGDWYQSDRTVDPIEAMIVNGKWSSPTEGAVVVFGPGDERRWRRITADADGWLKDDDVPGGYFLLLYAARVNAPWPDFPPVNPAT